MRKILFIFALLGAGIVQGNSQEVLSLEECLNIGIENNLSLQTKRNDMEKGKYTLSENRARLLPQINGFANFNDNIDPPVSVTDGSAFGVPYNVTQTLQYTANAGIQLQMPLYNQTLYIITDYGADAYGGGDCSGIINKLIEDMPLSGGCIVIPEGTFVLDNPIEINKNYITIKGVNSGMRSNIDVKELDLLIGAGGGSKIVLRNTDCAFHIPVMENVNNSINRISGVEIKDLMISGGEKNNGIGIFIEHDNDRCQISNVIGINLQKGVEAHKCDALIIKDSWFCEMKSGIELYGGIQNKITDCQLGAQPDGITCLLQLGSGIRWNPFARFCCKTDRSCNNRGPVAKL